MRIDKKKLEVALSTIKEDDECDIFSSGRFDHLIADIHLHVSREDEYHEIANYLFYTDQDLSNLKTIVLRLDWLKALYNRGGFR